MAAPHRRRRAAVAGAGRHRDHRPRHRMPHQRRGRSHDFRPSPGRIASWRPPSGEGVRLDSHMAEGAVIPPYYDSMVGKLIVHGRDRADAITKLSAALADFEVEGVPTTIALHRAIVATPTSSRTASTPAGWSRPSCPPGPRTSKPMAHISFLDETMRDGQQSLWGMRMQAGMALPVAPTIDRTGYSTVSFVGSSLFEVLIRHCHEDPWAGLDLVMGELKHTPVRGGIRSNGSVTFGFTPDALMDLWMDRVCAHGVRSWWIYDVLFNIDKMHRLARLAKAPGLQGGGHHAVHPVAGAHRRLLRRQGPTSSPACPRLTVCCCTTPAACSTATASRRWCPPSSPRPTASRSRCTPTTCWASPPSPTSTRWSSASACCTPPSAPWPTAPRSRPSRS